MNWNKDKSLKFTRDDKKILKNKKFCGILW